MISHEIGHRYNLNQSKTSTCGINVCTCVQDYKMYSNQDIFREERRTQAENVHKVQKVVAHVVRKQRKCYTDEPALVEIQVNSYSSTQRKPPVSKCFSSKKTFNLQKLVLCRYHCIK